MDSAQEKLAKIVAFAREELGHLDGDPGTELSPDGYCEREAAAGTLRHVLAIADPGSVCPPHHFNGQATMVRGEAVFTCELCGDAFVGSWEQENLKEKPLDAPKPCPTCEGSGWSGGVAFGGKVFGEVEKFGHPCTRCGGSSVDPPDQEKALEVQAEHQRTLERAERSGFTVPA